MLAKLIDTTSTCKSEKYINLTLILSLKTL